MPAPTQNLRAPKAQSRMSLSAAQRWLIDALSHVGFGSIEDLHVRNGEPLFDPPPKRTREWRIGDRRADGPPTRSDDFTLKAEQVELLEILRQVKSGIVQRISVRHGLPYHVSITEPRPAGEPIP